MIDFTAVKLQNIATHFIGNKLRDEGIKISSGEVNIIEEDTKKYLFATQRLNNVYIDS